MHVNGTFAKLLAPIKVEDFFQTYWEEKPLHVRRETTDYYDSFVTVSELDRYFQRSDLSPSFLRVVKGGADCKLDGWTKIDQRKNTDPYRIVVVDKLFSLFSQGATIIINAAQTAISGLTFLCASLEQELETRIQPNVYITPVRAQGLGYHYDSHDVFILQISGSKQWRLYDSDVRLPVWDSLTSGDYEHRKPKEVVELAPGDLLYLPRGTVHFATTSETPSIHVTVGLISRYWFHLLEELADIAKQDEAFRHAIPQGFSTAQDKSDFIAAFRDRLKDFCEKIDVEALLERSSTHFVSHQLIERRTWFQDLLKLHRLTLDSVVSCRPGIAYQLKQNGTNVVIRFGSEELSLPRFMMTTLESLLRERPYAVREVNGPVSDSGKLDLVKRFVQAGLVKIDGV